jgi:hypothetical protein
MRWTVHSKHWLTLVLAATAWSLCCHYSLVSPLRYWDVPHDCRKLVEQMVFG